MQWKVKSVNDIFDFDKNQDKLNKINNSKTQKTINDIYNINIKDEVKSPLKATKKFASKDNQYKKSPELKPQQPESNRNINTYSKPRRTIITNKKTSKLNTDNDSKKEESAIDIIINKNKQEIDYKHKYKIIKPSSVSIPK